MVEHSPQNATHVLDVGLVIEHVGMPHEFGFLARHYHLFRTAVAQVKELNVYVVAGIKAEQLDGEVTDEPVLPQTGVKKPLLSDRFCAVVERMKFMCRVDCSQREV